LDNIERQTNQEQAEKQPPIDASVKVIFSERALEAYFRISPPFNGGKAPTMEMLEQALAQNRVVYGIKRDKLALLERKPLYGMDVMVAQGKPPVNGKDGSYQLLIKADKEFRPKERDDGTVDLLELGIVENVSRGQLLCKITLPTNGTEGMTVTGAPIPASRGKSVPSMTGQNTQQSEDGTEIYATIDGQVEFNRQKINVNETFTVQEDVDTSTGNIRVTGNVVVKGSVRTGFCVEATGNIEVKSTVENAVLKAGGNINLRGGIIGGEISCKGELNSKYIENSKIEVAGDIRAEYILNSLVMCGKSIRTFGHARIVGGKCMAGEDIEAREIGSAAGTSTSVELTLDPATTRRQQELMKLLPELESNLGKLLPLINLLSSLKQQGRLDREKEEILENALYSKNNMLQQQADAKKELAELGDILANRQFGRIICKGTTYPGARIKIGEECQNVAFPICNMYFYREKGVICQAPSY